MPIVPSELRAAWASTPAELFVLIEGAMKRDERSWERTAWLGAQVINMSGKQVNNPVTVAELLGRSRPIDAAEAQKMLEEQGRIIEGNGEEPTPDE